MDHGLSTTDYYQPLIIMNHELLWTMDFSTTDYWDHGFYTLVLAIFAAIAVTVAVIIERECTTVKKEVSIATRLSLLQVWEIDATVAVVSQGGGLHFGAQMAHGVVVLPHPPTA